MDEDKGAIKPYAEEGCIDLYTEEGCIVKDKLKRGLEEGCKEAQVTKGDKAAVQTNRPRNRFEVGFMAIE